LSHPRHNFSDFQKPLPQSDEGDADEDWDLEEAEEVAPAALAALPAGVASTCGVVAFSWAEVDALAAFLAWCDGRKDLLAGAGKRGQPPLAARAKALRKWGPQ